MDNKKTNHQIMEVKTLKQNSYSYSRRKQCIKRKAMELATLCGINACTIIYEPDGKVESWPENPTAINAIIKNYKILTNNPLRKTTIRDESQKKVILSPIQDESQKKVTVLPYGGVDYWPEKSRTAKRARIEDKADDVNLMEIINKNLPYLSKLSLTESNKEEVLKQLDYKLQALTKRIESLRRDRQYHIDSCSENKRWCGSKKASHTPFSFDLNYPPNEAECSSLSSEDYKPVPVSSSDVHCRHSSSTSASVSGGRRGCKKECH